MDKPKIPCDEALSAMPGDVIEFTMPEEMGTDRDVVASAGWLPSPNKGKVWVYHTVHGLMVPNDCVSKVNRSNFKPIQSLGKDEAWSEVRIKQEIMRFVDMSKMSHFVKTSIICLLEGDLKNFEIAQNLMAVRIQQLTELGFEHHQITNTNNPLKEDI